MRFASLSRRGPAASANTVIFRRAGPSKAGFTHYDDLNGLNAVDQLGKSYGWVLLSGATVLLGGMIFRGGWNSISLWSWFLSGIILSIYPIISSRSYRRKMRHVPSGGIAEANRSFHPIRPWALAKEWALMALAAQIYRLQIDVVNMRRFSEREAVVDAEIQCTAEQAAYLRRQIAEWIAQAKHKDNDKSVMRCSTKSDLMR